MINSSVWHIIKTLTGTTIPGQSRSGSNVNEGILYITQTFTTGWLVGWLVGFYVISTIVDYLIPNHIYTYVTYIWIQNELLVGKIFNKPERIYLHTVNWFHVLLYKANISISAIT